MSDVIPESLNHLVSADDEKSLRAEIERLQRDQQNMIYSMSHDMQAPLRTIVGFSKLFNNQYNEVLPEKAQTWLTHMREAGETLQAMLTSLLEYSRLTTQPLAAETVDLNEAVKVVILQLTKKGYTCESIDIANSLPAVMAPSTHVKRVLFHLLQNAMQYADPQRRLHIKISSCIINNRNVELSIQDNGIGFRPENMQNAFLIFKRFDGPCNHEHIGMGLPMCKRILELMNMPLDLQSEHTQGTTVTFQLPLAH